MEYPSDYFPILGIHEFNHYPSQKDNVLYHELHGERVIDKPHKHDFFIIILFEQGRGIHTIDFIDYQIESRQIHLMYPDQVHQWKLEDGTIGYQLMISRKWFESFLPSLRFSASYYQNHPIFKVSEEAYQLFLHEFLSIKNELNSKAISWEIIQTRCVLMGLLVDKAVEKSSADFEVYNSNPIISKFLTLINQHFKQEHSVAFYAEKLYISANYLNIVCRKNLNSSASTLIQNRILLEAKRLLKVSEMSVKDIVYELGFYDHANFSKFFKSQTGMTPSQFKEG